MSLSGSGILSMSLVAVIKLLRTGLYQAQRHIIRGYSKSPVGEVPYITRQYEQRPSDRQIEINIVLLFFARLQIEYLPNTSPSFLLYLNMFPLCSLSWLYLKKSTLAALLVFVCV